jgi:hypothetical protein
MDFTVDGNSSLQDQQNTLNHTESQGSLKLTSYSGDADDATHTNTASFEDRDITQPLPPLTLAESPSGNDVWVSGVLKKVAATR